MSSNPERAKANPMTEDAKDLMSEDLRTIRKELADTRRD
jgi:hypothetical protein